MMASKKIPLTILFLLSIQLVFSQTHEFDLLTENNNPETTITKKEKLSEFNLKKLVRIPFDGALYFYQKLLSPQLDSYCHYEISCSNFAGEIISKKGVFSGVFLTADRMQRCNIMVLDEVPRFRVNNHNRITDDFYLGCH